MVEHFIKPVEPFIDLEELAEKLIVHKSWIYSRTRLKGPDAIPHLKAGKYCRFRLSEVLAWLEKQSEK